MLRNAFYPKHISEQAAWHLNLAAKLAIYGAGLGLSAQQINNAIADNLTLAYALGAWRTSVREFGPAVTGALEDLRNGTGGDPFVFTTYTVPTPPTLPVGADPVLPGALVRTFGLIQGMKGNPGYTEAKGLDMGIVGSEAPPPPPPGTSPAPEIFLKIIAGTLNQYVSAKFFKRGHEYVVLESRRGAGPWEQIAQSNASPYIDTRDLLVAGVAEVREYRARFWDNGEPTSDWCNVARITVGP